MKTMKHLRRVNINIIEETCIEEINQTKPQLSFWKIAPDITSDLNQQNNDPALVTLNHLPEHLSLDDIWGEDIPDINCREKCGLKHYKSKVCFLFYFNFHKTKIQIIPCF